MFWALGEIVERRDDGVVVLLEDRVTVAWDHVFRDGSTQDKLTVGRTVWVTSRGGLSIYGPLGRKITALLEEMAARIEP